MTSWVKIREHREGDAEASFAAVRESLNELSHWMPWCHSGYSLQDAEEWVTGAASRFEDRTAFEFAISNISEDYLGGCGLNQIRPLDRVANLGYWVRSSQHSKGIATAAARQLVTWAFSNTDLIRLEIVVGVGNGASRRVAEKLGAEYEGLLRKRVFLNGRSEDALMFALLRPEATDVEGVASKKSVAPS